MAFNMKDLEQRLAKMTLAHDNTSSEKEKLEQEFPSLKDYALIVHFKDFNQTIFQAIFLYRCHQ